MSQKSRSISYIARAAFFFFVFCLPGCLLQKAKPIISPPPMDEFTKNIIQKTIKLNQNIYSLKGKGFLSLDTQKIKARFRMIWAAQAPNKIRITLLDSGNPIETIVSNGKNVNFLSHTGAHPAHKTTTGNKAMKRLFGVDIPFEHIARLLLGQLPLSAFSDVTIIPQSPRSQYSTVVITKNKNHTHRQKLFWNNKGQIQQIIMEKSPGIMLNGIKFDLWGHIQKYQIPGYINIRNKNNENLTLNIESIEPNIFIKPAIFELRKP